ncbi:MAG: hypothetical protein PHX21_03385 [bacterium]|nr:hypothetical protein [bacterium]
MDCERSNASNNGANFSVVRQGRKVRTGGEMRKFAAIIAISAVIAGTASAVNMGGKIGFGVGSASSSYYDPTIGKIGTFVQPACKILEPSNISMKIGITNSIVLEPTVFYHTTMLDQKTDPATDSTKYTGANMGIGCRALFAVIKKEKSNFYGTFQFAFGTPSYITEDYSNATKYTLKKSGMTYNVLLGLALEHFITSNFSVCIISEAGYGGGTYKEERTANNTTTTNEEGSTTDMLLGNTNFGIFLFWYL